jgi:hypothetical protein
MEQGGRTGFEWTFSCAEWLPEQPVLLNAFPLADHLR